MSFAQNTIGFETQPVGEDTISLSTLLQGARVETSDDVGRFLTSLFPPSFEMLTSGGIVVTEAEFTAQYSVRSNRPGSAIFAPSPDATADDGPLTDVVVFTGWAADYFVTGNFYLAGHALVVDISWTQPDGTIVLVESFAKTIHPTPPTDATIASPIPPSVSGGLKCKCSHASGACSDKQCDAARRCWTGGTHGCSWVKAE